MSKDQTKKKADSSGISILEIPFSAKEKKALRAILTEAYWNRRKMKNKFVDEYGRLPEEVDAYIAANGKLKGKRKDSSEPVVTKGESKPKLTARIRGGEPLGKGSGKPSELRVPFTGLRIEGAVLVIEYER